MYYIYDMFACSFIVHIFVQSYFVDCDKVWSHDLDTAEWKFMMHMRSVVLYPNPKSWFILTYNVNEIEPINLMKQL